MYLEHSNKVWSGQMAPLVMFKREEESVTCLSYTRAYLPILLVNEGAPCPAAKKDQGRKHEHCPQWKLGQLVVTIEAAKGCS